MKGCKNILGIVLLIALWGTVAAFDTVEKRAKDATLLETITQLDSAFFTAYNNCDLATQEALIAEDIEFYHDQGGLSTSKTEIMSAIEKNICGKVRRELVKGSIEVSEIPGDGAVEIGLHKFYNNQEPNAVSKPSRFVTLWKKNGETWQMTRIISLHTN